MLNPARSRHLSGDRETRNKSSTRRENYEVTKLTALALSTAICAPAAFAADMADEMTIVSWGGAYSHSQQMAYHEPYMAKTGVKIINDESSNEAVAKLRAMNEAGT